MEEVGDSTMYGSTGKVPFAVPGGQGNSFLYATCQRLIN